MTALTPAENYAVASEIMAEVSQAIGEGARPEVVERDIARAQVYATLASTWSPDRTTLAEAISASLRAQDIYVDYPAALVAAEAVARLL